MVRILPVVFGLLVLFVVGSWVLRGRASRADARPRRSSRPEAGRLRVGPPLRQALPSAEGPLSAPDPRADEIVAWLDAHDGVEAYVEPRTVMSQLSVVLVDGVGEWRRFELNEDRVLRDLARERRLPVFDASRTGYPPRMRRSRG